MNRPFFGVFCLIMGKKMVSARNIHTISIGQWRFYNPIEGTGVSETFGALLFGNSFDMVRGSWESMILLLLCQQCNGFEKVHWV
jgi:hypothetical protein